MMLWNRSFFLLLLAMAVVLAVSIIFKQRKQMGTAVNKKEYKLFKVMDIVNNMEILRTICKPVTTIDDNIRENLYRMRETMYASGGIGIAANQVGLRDCMVVIDLQERGLKKPIYLINPEIVWHSRKKKSFEESCLSVPSDSASRVVRADGVTVKYLDEYGVEKSTGKVGGLFAVCLQHELGHLRGELYIDLLSREDRNKIVEKAPHILEKRKNSK
ncbi:MAG: peptide deformylase [Rickettsiales bacterium]|jgi:peptide deformylase|nr:peptide deformylase [Rickettsiales bacterium]